MVSNPVTTRRLGPCVLSYIFRRRSAKYRLYPRTESVSNLYYRSCSDRVERRCSTDNLQTRTSERGLNEYLETFVIISDHLQRHGGMRCCADTKRDMHFYTWIHMQCQQAAGQRSTADDWAVKVQRSYSSPSAGRHTSQLGT